MVKTEYVTTSPAETQALGAMLAQHAAPDTVFCFTGDLAAGKTTLIKGLVEAATGVAAEEVSSPTFGYLCIYEGKQTLYHFDLYRLDSADEFLGMGFDEHLSAGGICAVEWSERITPILNKLQQQVITVAMEHLSDGQRRITVTVL